MKDYSPEVSFRVRTIPGGRAGRMLLIMWLAGMAGMMLGLLLTFGNLLGGVAGLTLPMLWISLKMTRRAEYAVSTEGVRETMLDPQGKPDSAKQKRYRWSEVESWQVDSDLIRSVGSRRFIELRMRDGYRMRFREANDKPEDPEFSAFAAALQEAVGAAPLGSAALPPPVPQLAGAPGRTAARSPAPAAAAPPTRRPSFYERPIAKLITLTFIALTVGLLIVAIFAPQYFGVPAWFRLLVIVIPGTLYMVARSFGRR